MTSRQYAVVLLMLTGLFSCRVLAQLVQVWHGGALPCGLLIADKGRFLLPVCGLSGEYSRKRWPFQRKNVDLRLGMLNDLISGRELHRWHHSMVKQESNHNYGNNLIIWDRVFRIWYLPTE